jgi:hypothetical protein
MNKGVVVRVIKFGKGQSMTEFALILPVFMLLVLGMVQAGLIFINAMMLKYAAYMTARVAVVYPGRDIRQLQAGKAEQMIKLGLNSQDKIAAGADTLLSAGSELASNYLSNLSADNRLKVEEVKMESSKGAFLKVEFTYAMPLEIPVANKIFGMFQKQPSDVIGLAQNSIYPVYNLKSTAIERLE